MCFNYRRPFFLLPSRIYKWSVQAIYCQKHKNKKILTRRQYHQHAIDKKRFLTREKTVSRKLEEILLVYILENNRIVSKNECLKFILILLNGDPMYME
jgi:hypothetical protein